MTNVGFLLNFPKEYKGGINYIRNLMFACSQIESDLNIFLFMPENIEQEYVIMFSPYATIIKTKLLNRKSIPWLTEKIIERVFHKNFFLLRLLKKYKVSVVSHSNVFNRDKEIRTINWIPDFQCLHYPDLWSKSDLKATYNLYNKIVKYSDRVIVSSHDALKDYKGFAPDYLSKVKVLQFVSQPAETGDENTSLITETLSKHGIDRKFFYLPNQFWSHKNHLIVFKAIKILKSNGIDPLLVTTGFMYDYRTNNQTYNLLNSYILDNDLSKNILLLGLIPYKDVLTLFTSCEAVLNPSHFEGWSSSVEESKSIGKTIILSDIPIHREQNPKKGIYFNPANENELASIMQKLLLIPTVINENNAERESVRQDLIERTKSFGMNYVNIVKSLT